MPQLNDAKKIAAGNRVAFYSIIAFFFTLGVVIGVDYLLKDIPNALNMDYIVKTYNLPLYFFIPEKPEFCQYAFTSIAFPILFCIFYKLASLIKIKLGNPILFTTYFFETAIMITVIYIASKVLPKEWAEWIFDQKIILFILLFLIFQMLFLKLKRIIEVILFFLGACVILFLSWLFVTNTFFMNNVASVMHADAYFYPVFEVFHGKTLVVDFNSLYGFYPYIIAPILKLFGNISMLNFSIFVAVMIFIAFGSIFFVLWQNVKNKILVLVSFCSIIYVTNCFYYSSNIYYFQYTPHRLIGPALLLLVVSLFLHATDEAKKKILYIIGFVVSTFSLFWNFDTGVIVVASWALFLLYRIALEYKLSEKRFYIESLKVCVYSIGVVIVTVLSVLLITLIKSGQIISLKDMIASQMLFLGTGFYMLPMDKVGPWILLGLTYLFGLVKSLRNMAFLRIDETPFAKIRSSMYFFVSVLGIGLFSYFQGRSHIEVFSVVIWPGIILGCMFIQEYLVKISIIFKSVNSKITRTVLNFEVIVLAAKTILALVLIGMFAVNLVNVTLIPDGKIKDLYTKPYMNKPLTLPGMDFIEQNMPANKKIDLLIEYLEEYYTVLGTSNPMDVRSCIDWFTKDDYAKVIKWLETTQNDLIIDSKVRGLLDTYVPSELNDVLNRRFVQTKTNGNFTLYKLK